MIKELNAFQQTSILCSDYAGAVLLPQSDA